GHATAAAVDAAGGKVSVIGESGLAELVESWGDSADGKTVVLPHSSLSDLAPLEALGDQARILATAVYSTSPIAAADDPVDAALFASPSAVTGWLRSRTLDDVVIGAIGPTTARGLTDRGHPPHVTASRPDFEMLIDITARHLRDRSPV
ncbi:MAG: hypothetical protein DWQ40_11835, partial [Actinobacteria bacterium]